ncbi:PREDICTED: F-box protein SKIP23-like [Nicotiana attenuata]|uniref:F-box protein skip23 n=1 Tax=Nicotiana attenuata TaxID=49451 RepID=A0A1J6ISZ0_NICAT|nr:PREDICTED: F-box protein SKIP23-like [Nicotiana attenuata]OIS98264.1 f-box protein skip23 [Nicotiana attenuata]
MHMGSGIVMIPWSDLPKELVERIGKFLDTHIDVLRFRAVCTTWRSSLPPFKNSPPLPLKIPFPLLNLNPDTAKPEFYHLIDSTVYLFQPPDGAAPTANSSCKGWLIKVIKTADGKLRVLNPLTDRLIKDLPDNMPKVLNLLDFRVSQVCKSYHVQSLNNSRLSYGDYDVGYVRKILLLTNHAESETNNFSIMAIDRGDSLYYINLGDEKWTRLKNASCFIVDIIVYKGNFYAVDRYGETIKFDNSFNETNVASRLSYGGRKKRLVESCGQLFLVDTILGVDKNTNAACPDWNIVEIKMYRLDEEQHEWIEVVTLGDRILFACNDCCFSVSSHDFDDCRGNCIYYVNGWEYYDDESDDDLGCGCCCGFNDDDNRPTIGDDMTYNSSVSDDDHKIYDFDSKSGDDAIRSSISYDNHKINDSSSKSGLVHGYEGLFDQNTCVFNVEDGKLGSLLSFLEYAEILWPPPYWLTRQDQAHSDSHEITEP